MSQAIAPVACKPWALNGLSERLIASHYENNYGAAVRSFNAIRRSCLCLLRVRLPRRLWGLTAALRERGFDAKYIRGGLSAWYAAGGERALKPRHDA
jgi:hypothetical protein